MRIGGIDFNSSKERSSVDVVVLPFDNDEYETQWYPVLLESKEPLQAARELRRRLALRVNWADVDLVYIEQPFSQNRHTLAVLMRMQGAIIASLPATVAVVNEIPAQAWKNVFVGNPKARKVEVAARARELGFTHPDLTEHATDAYGIAWAAREENRRAITRADQVA